MLKFFILFIFTFVLSAHEVGFNGKSISISLCYPDGEVIIGNQHFPVIKDPENPSKGLALIPIDYYAQPQKTIIKWKHMGGIEWYSFEILSFPYPTETLSVDSSKVTPPAEALQQIEYEKKEAENLYNTITPKRYWSKRFIPPMQSEITSLYGSARTYNGVLKSYHSGVDFRARTPLPIAATNDGKVVLVKERYYAGGTVIVDHGEGIYSCYFHMSQFHVHVGDYVKQGDILGLTGATGRITGPHLHFGIMLNGFQTDPLYFIDVINTSIRSE